MTSKLDKVDTVVSKMDGELKAAHGELEALVDKIFKDLKHFEQLIEDPDQMELDRGLHFLDVVIACQEMDILQSCCQEFEMDYHDEHEVSKRVEVSEPLIKQEITYVCDKDGPGLEDQQQQGPPPLKMAQENLEKLAQTTDERFETVLQSLEAVEKEAIGHTQYQKENSERIQLRFDRVQESLKDFIRAHRGNRRE